MEPGLPQTHLPRPAHVPHILPTCPTSCPHAPHPLPQTCRRWPWGSRAGLFLCAGVQTKVTAVCPDLAPSVLTLHQVSSPCTEMPPCGQWREEGGLDGTLPLAVSCSVPRVPYITSPPHPSPSRGRRVVLSELENPTGRLWSHQPGIAQ